MCQKIGYNDSSSWDKAWRFGSARATITMVSSITPIVLWFFQDFSEVSVYLKHWQSWRLEFWNLEKFWLKTFFLCICLPWGRINGPKGNKNPFFKPKTMVEHCFSPCNNGFFGGLLSNVFLTSVLIGLGLDGWL